MNNKMLSARHDTKNVARAGKLVIPINALPIFGPNAPAIKMKLGEAAAVRPEGSRWLMRPIA